MPSCLSGSAAFGVSVASSLAFISVVAIFCKKAVSLLKGEDP